MSGSTSVNPAALACLLIILATFQPVPVYAQQQCGDRDKLLTELKSQFGEQLVNRGVISRRGAMLEVTVNPETRTWTIFVTRPQGPSCIITFGDGWRDIKTIDPES